MFRIFHRTSRVFVCAAIAFAAAGSAGGATVSLPSVPVQILGADSFCTSWTPGVTAGVPTLTCVTGGGGPAPFFCSWTNGPPAGAIAPGTAVNLQINCVGGSAPYSYLWTPGNSTAASLSVSPTVTTAFSVTARDSASGTQTLPATVTVSSGGGGGGGGAISCAGVQGLGIQATGSTVVVDENWNNPTRQNINLGPNDTAVVRFTTGPDSGGVYVKISGAEFGSPAAVRYATLSTQACDFRTTGSGVLAASFSSSYSFYFTVGANDSQFYPGLSANTPYFVNIQTQPRQCSGICNMFTDLNKNGAP